MKRLMFGLIGVFMALNGPAIIVLGLVWHSALVTIVGIVLAGPAALMGLGVLYMAIQADNADSR